MSERADLNQALPLFLLRCDAESTKVAYERELRRFLAWLDRPEVGCCERYVAHLRERGLSVPKIASVWQVTRRSVSSGQSSVSALEKLSIT